MKKLQPTLRFSEFNQTWNEKELGDFTIWSSGGTPSKQNDCFWNGNIPWISASSMRGLIYSDSELKITPEGLKNGSRIANKGDLLLLVRGSMLFKKIPIGKVGIDVAFNQDIKSIKIKDDSFSDFILYWFFSKENIILDMVTATGIGAGKLDLKDLKEVKIKLPSPSEQTKIASFLSSVDEKLNLLKEKKEALESYKKGMMQKIFSQELRFKDDEGKNFAEWDEIKIGDVGEIITGKTPSTNDVSLWGGDVQFVTPTDISESKYQYKTSRFVVANNKLKILPKKSILFTCIASIGKMSLSVYPCITNQQINAIIPNTEFENEFVFYSLLYISEYIKSTQSNTTLPIINKTDFSNFYIFSPSIKEQTKIANFLSAIDDKITLVSTQIEEMQAYKKGLLQGMFC